MEMEHTRATIISNGPSNREDDKKMKAIKADCGYSNYTFVDLFIGLAFGLFLLYQLYTGYHSDEVKAKLDMAFYLAMLNSWTGPYALNDNKNGYYLAIYTVRLFLMAFLSAKYSLFSPMIDSAGIGPFMTVLHSCLLPFYAVGFLFFAYKTVAISVDISRSVKKGEWNVVPVRKAFLILYNILEQIVVALLSFSFAVWCEMSLGSKSWITLISYGLFSVVTTAGLFSLNGLLSKDATCLSVYCYARLLPMLIVSTVGAIACLFVPVDSTVNVVLSTTFFFCWGFLVPFYAIGMTLFTDKVIALRSDGTRVVWDREADVLVP